MQQCEVTEVIPTFERIPNHLAINRDGERAVIDDVEAVACFTLSHDVAPNSTHLYLLRHGDHGAKHTIRDVGEEDIYEVRVLGANGTQTPIECSVGHMSPETAVIGEFESCCARGSIWERNLGVREPSLFRCR